MTLKPFRKYSAKLTHKSRNCKSFVNSSCYKCIINQIIVNDLPDVDVTVVYDNVVMDNNVLYVVQGEILKVEGIDCKGNDGKQALVNNVTYFLNGFPQIHPIFAPYGVGIDTSVLAEGRYVLTMGMNILQVDKTLSTGMIDQSFIVVKSAEELPNGATPGEVTRTIRFTPK